MIDAALLVLRTVTGGLIAGHGAQKLFGSFQGPGPEKWRGMTEKIGMDPPDVWAPAGAGTELVGGALTLAGLGGPVGPAMAMGPMVIASTTVHWGKPIWATHGGAELAVTNLAALGALVLAGPGGYSADRVLGLRVPRWLGGVAVGCVAAGAAVALATRRKPQAEQGAQPQPEQSSMDAPQPSQAPEQSSEDEVELRAGAQRAKARRTPQTT